jgi:glutamate racemase
VSDRRAIGVFDSGFGGLTVLRELRRALPAESTVYLGDVARLPYGPRPREQVQAFAHEIARFLLERHDVKALVVACNTASAAAPELFDGGYDAPVIGVIRPGAHAAVAASRAGRIGVIATQGTVASGAYTRAVHALAPHARVIEQACPRLVPLVETGETAGPHVEAVLADYLAPLLAEGVDTLILGCTHYPLLRPAIERVVAGRMQVVDSAHTTAAETAALLDYLGLYAPPGVDPAHTLYTTGSPKGFRRLATRLFGEDLGDVSKASLAEVVRC